MSPKSLRLVRRAGRPSRVAGLATLVMLAAGMLIGSALGYTGIRLPGGYGYGYGHSCVTSDQPTQTATTAAMTSGTGPTPPPPPTAPPASASRCNDPRPQADFAVTPTSPSAGSLVHVDAYRSQGVEITYAWDLDEDGTFGEEGETGVRPPAFRFTTPGAHAIALRITDSAGRVSRSTQHFQVRADNVRPVVGMARLTPTGPSTNEPAQLVVGAVDPDGEVVSVEAAWEGGTDFSPVPRHQQVANAFVAPHTYTTPGQRKIVVRATDDAGGVATQTVDVHVHDGNRAPMLSVYANTTTPRVGRAIGMYANSSDSDGRIVKLQWDFEGDGTIDKTVEGDAVFSQVSHTYETADEATVVAIATDDDGATSKATQRIRPQATNTPPSVNFNSTSGQPRVNESLTLSAYGSDEDDPYTGGGVVEYAWDLDGDGTYEEANTGPNLTSRPKTFTTQGAHLVRVRVKDTDGAYGYAVQAFNVGPANIAPRISTLFAETATPTVDKPVKLNVDGWDPDGRPGPMGMGEPITYTWDLDGDGAYDDATTESVGGSTTTFVPAQAGSRRVGVRATDADGATDAVHRTITIRAAEQSSGFAPEVELRPTRKSAAVNRPVQFNAYATDADGDQLTYSWDVDGDTIFGDDVDGDGTFDADDQTSAATVSFPATGEHPVRVRVSDGTNAADALALLPVHATNLRPTGYVNGNDRAFPGDSVSLYVSANDEDGSVARYEWDLDGDGSFETDTGTTPTVSQTYASPGTLQVGLRVTDSDSAGAQTSRTITVDNRGPAASFTATPNPASAGSRADFDASGSTDPDGTIARYEWDLDGNGSFETDTGVTPTTSRVYPTPGPVTVTLRVTDSNGSSAEAATTLLVRDTRPPRLRLAAIPRSRTRIAAFLRNGLPLIVRAQEPFSCTGRLRLDRSTARTLRLRRVVIASARCSMLTPGTNRLLPKPTRSARSALRRRPRGFTTMVALSARDVAGNTASLSKRVRFRR